LIVCISGFFVARAFSAFSSNCSVSTSERRSHMPMKPSRPPMKNAIRQP
jgi:hypothetical protein